MVDKILEVVGPAAKEGGSTELVEELACGIQLAIEQGATCQILQQLRAPAILYAILHTQTVTIVGQSEVVIHQMADDMIGVDRQLRGVRLRTLGEVIHLLSLAAHTAECQIVHDDDGACWLRVLTSALVDDTLPVEALDAMLHAEFMMKILIAIPPRSRAAPSSPSPVSVAPV